MYTLFAVSVFATTLIYHFLLLCSLVSLLVSRSRGTGGAAQTEKAAYVLFACIFWMYAVRALYGFGKETAASLLLLALPAFWCFLAAAESRRRREGHSGSLPVSHIPFVAGTVPASFCALLGMACLADVATDREAIAGAALILAIFLAAGTLLGLRWQAVMTERKEGLTL